MDKESLKKRIEKCNICDKPRYRSFSVGKKQFLHACKKHSIIVSVSAITLARLYAE